MQNRASGCFSPCNRGKRRLAVVGISWQETEGSWGPKTDLEGSGADSTQPRPQSLVLFRPAFYYLFSNCGNRRKCFRDVGSRVPGRDVRTARPKKCVFNFVKTPLKSHLLSSGSQLWTSNKDSPHHAIIFKPSVFLCLLGFYFQRQTS